MWINEKDNPDGVSAEDLLRLPGHIFVKSNVVEELKSKGEFKRKERKERKSKRKEKHVLR